MPGFRRSPAALLPTVLFISFVVLLSGRAAAPASASVPATSIRSLVVGYLPQWGLYSTPAWVAKNLVTSGAAELLDQIDYAQGTVRDGKCVIADPEADLNHVYPAEQSVDGRADPAAAAFRGGLHQLALLRQRYPRIRTLLSIEGKALEFTAAAQPAVRAAFVSSCIDTFVRGHLAPGVEAPGLFDGIDLDWEFPPTAEDGANYTALVAEFRRQLDALEAPRGGRTPARKLLLTIAVGPGLGRYPGVDWHAIQPLVDQVGLMNYDYNGPWQQQTGFLAPLFTVAGDPRPQNTVDNTVREYEGAGIPAGKLLVGVPFYGYHWEGVAAANRGLFQPGQSVRADTPYSQIAPLAAHATLYRDEHSQTPWLMDGSTFWTFDDPVSARAKAEYARTQAARGVMVWDLSGDTADAGLLRAIRGGLGGGAGHASR